MRKDGRQSDNVEDRRGSSGGGNISMGTIMMLAPLIKGLLRTKIGWAIITRCETIHCFRIASSILLVMMKCPSLRQL